MSMCEEKYRKYENKRMPSGKKYSELRICIRVLHDKKEVERGIVVTAGERVDTDSTKVHIKLIECLQSEIDEFMINVDKVTADKGKWYEKNDIMTV